MYKGLGNPFLKTNNVGDGTKAAQRLLPLELNSFSFDATTDGQKTSTKFNSAGELITAETVGGTTTYQFTLSYNKLNWATQGLALGQFARTATTISIPSEVVTTTVPLTAPYEIVDADITALKDAANPYLVSIPESGVWGSAKALTRSATAPTPNQVQVDTAGTKFVFNAAQAGAPVTYIKYNTYSSIEDYGGPTGAVKWGEFEYWGRVFMPDMGASGEILYVPKATIVEQPSFTVDDSVPTVSIVCAMNTVTGWDKPYRIFNMQTAVLAA